MTVSGQELVDRARQHRSSGAVLKVKVSNMRSRNRLAAILVFEGFTDLGPYHVWINRINSNLNAEFLAAAGKSQVLDFRRRLVSDRTGLAKGVFMFVDRDFDELRGQEKAEDIYCTDMYSIENYFVSKKRTEKYSDG